MTNLSDLAINECVSELRGACRLPIDPSALDMVVGWLRPNFERLLDQPIGAKRWGDHGQRMRDNARHLGAFADFFGNHVDSPVIGRDEMRRAFAVIRADCTVRAEFVPLAAEYCGEDCDTKDDCEGSAPVDIQAAERFLRTMAPIPAPRRRAA